MASMTQTHNIPLAAMRHRYGLYALILALPAFLLACAVLLVALPPDLRGGGLLLIAAVVGITLFTGLASLLWTRVMVWPTERKRLEGAERVQRLDQVPPGRDYAPTQLVLLVVGGLCVAATLWAVVSYLGFVGAPMLWVAVGIANMEKARRLQRLEREQNVVYYQAPRTTARGKRRSALFAVPASAP
jgi:hypothetical protein